MTLTVKAFHVLSLNISHCSDGRLLMCVFFLSSPHEINWLRVDKDVPSHAVVTGSDLYIENLNKSFNGTYRCIASNAVGEAYEDYILYVYGTFLCVNAKANESKNSKMP